MDRLPTNEYHQIQNTYEFYIFAAEQFSRILKIPLDEALKYTPLVRRYTWKKSKYCTLEKVREIIQVLHTTHWDDLEAVFLTQKQNRTQTLKEILLEQFWCFSFEYNDWTIWIHFSPSEFDSSNRTWPLSKENKTLMIQDLTRMFSYIKNVYPQAHTVTWNSWIHSLKAYQRLFPARTYSTDIKDFESKSLWWQFVDHTWALKQSVVQEFIQRLVWAKSLKDINASFPHKQYGFITAIEKYYRFYWIQ